MEGVRVAVYVVPEPVKLVSFPPPVTVTSASVKSLVDSLNVNVKLMLASFEVKPLSPSADVIVIVGDVVMTIMTISPSPECWFTFADVVKATPTPIW